MALLERIRCTNCGGEFDEYDPTATVMRCSREGCKATFIIRQAAAFAKVQLDHDQDIRTLRKLLSEAVQKKDAAAIWERANSIRKWIPDDFFAGFCEVLARKLQGKPKEYYQFLQSSHHEQMTDENRDSAFGIALQHFDIHDRDSLTVFIQKNFAQSQHEKKYLLDQMIIKMYDEQNRYAEIPRDIFICYSSSDTETALQVYDRLIADGNTCWISSRNLPPDTVNYWETITNAIKKSKIILVISSLECMLRPDTQKEMRIAQEAGIQRLEYKIDDWKHTTFFKFYFDGIQWINGCGSLSQSLDQLCERIFLLLNPNIREKKFTDKEKPMIPASGTSESTVENTNTIPPAQQSYPQIANELTAIGNAHPFYDPNQSGLVVFWDGWLYCEDEDGISRMDINCEHKSLFIKGEYSGLYTHGGFIYTVDYLDDETCRLIRISLKVKNIDVLMKIADGHDVLDMRIIRNRLYCHMRDDEDRHYLKSINLITRQKNVHISNMHFMNGLQADENDVLVSWYEKHEDESIQFALFNETGIKKDFQLAGPQTRSLHSVSVLYHPDKGYYGYITKESNKMSSVLCFYDHEGNEKFVIDIYGDMGLISDAIPVISGTGVWLLGKEESGKGILHKFDLDKKKAQKISNFDFPYFGFQYQVIENNLYFYDDENIVRTMPIELEMISERKVISDQIVQSTDAISNQNVQSIDAPCVSTDGWIYYIANDGIHKPSLFRVSEDGKQQMKISGDNEVRKFAIIDEWIYYTNGKYTMYKMKADGGENQVAFERYMQNGNFVFSNNHFFYTTGNDYLYKIVNDGTAEKALCYDSVLIYMIDDNWIYYINGSDKDRIYKIHTDGTRKKALTKDGANCQEKMVVDGDWIYYISKEDDNLYRISKDGIDKGMVTVRSYSKGYDIVDNNVYYVGFGEDPNRLGGMLQILMRKMIGTSQAMKIASFSAPICIQKAVNDFVLYEMSTDGKRSLFASSTDGTITTLISDLLDNDRFTIIGGWVYAAKWQEGLYRIRADGNETQLFAKKLSY